MERYLPPLIGPDGNDELLKCFETLAQVLQILGIPDASFASYSAAISQMSKESLSLSCSLNRFKRAEHELQTYLAALEHESHLITHWNKSMIPGSSNTMGLETAAITERRRETLVKKAKEYHKELESHLVNEPLHISVTVTQYLEQKRRNQAIEQELIEKRAKVRAFQGLPPNLELARHELREARQRQMELIQLRERLLGRMAEGVV
ncbi:hypothetical protein B0H34DRAFT_685801 [Crassisporium funariophilum]|nr:hypothetical protein B0H34DRAFT_685801 [Crassisporium funariophilum]